MTTRDVVFAPGRQALSEMHRYSPAVRSNDLLFVSGQVGSQEDGSPEPDLKAQVRKAFQNLNAVLAAADCTFDDVVDVTIFMVNPDQIFETIWNEVAPEYWGQSPYPNVTGVGVTWLAGFDFEIKVTARIPSRSLTSVSRYNPPTIWDMGSLGYSQISVAEPGRIAFLSGQVAWMPDGGEVPQHLTGQAKAVAVNLASALKELGASGKDIIMLRVYVVDATTEKFQQVQTFLDELKGEGMPSITTIGVQALYSPDILVEIEMVVRIP